jgi:hypothetical protein
LFVGNLLQLMSVNNEKKLFCPNISGVEDIQETPDVHIWKQTPCHTLTVYCRRQNSINGVLTGRKETVNKTRLVFLVWNQGVWLFSMGATFYNDLKHRHCYVESTTKSNNTFTVRWFDALLLVARDGSHGG